jgi:hypothetical protein
MRLAEAWSKLPLSGNLTLHEALELLQPRPELDGECLADRIAQINEAYEDWLTSARRALLSRFHAGRCLHKLRQLVGQEEFSTIATDEIEIPPEEVGPLLALAEGKEEGWEPNRAEVEAFANQLLDKQLVELGISLEDDDE